MILLSFFQGTLYEGSRQTAENFKTLVTSELQLDNSIHSEDSSHQLSLLYVRRNHGKRGFERSTEMKFRKLLFNSKMTVREADFSSLNFKEQVEAIMSSNVIIGIHGANLLNPSLFLNPGTVLLELFPWHFLWRGYANTSMVAGGIYIGYMLDKSRQKESTLSVSDCFWNKGCMLKYRDQRHLRLSQMDEKTIEELLSISRNISSNVALVRESKNEKFQVSAKLVKPSISRDCIRFDRDAQMSWISFLDEEQDKLQFCGLSISNSSVSA